MPKENNKNPTRWPTRYFCVSLVNMLAGMFPPYWILPADFPRHIPAVLVPDDLPDCLPTRDLPDCLPARDLPDCLLTGDLPDCLSWAVLALASADKFAESDGADAAYAGACA